MVDIETLGTDVESTIFQIAAVIFDVKTGNLSGSFNKIADVSLNENLDMAVNGSTLKWWLSQPDDLFRRLLERGDISSSQLIQEFYDWLKILTWSGDVYLWGNGATFDNVRLKYHFEREGLEYPIAYDRDRDMRTVVELVCMKHGYDQREFRKSFQTSEFETHDAGSDSRLQAIIVAACYKDLLGKTDEIQ